MRLDLGCGRNKKPGFLGLDRVWLPGVDVICNIDRWGIPLASDSVDETCTVHFLEHVSDLVSVMEELWRVGKNGAKVTIAVPYYTSVGAFSDPTHRRFFAFRTFDYFTDTTKVPTFYSHARFRIICRKLLFYPTSSNLLGRLRLAHMLPFQFIANSMPYLYEHSILKLFSPRDLYVELEVVKR